MALNATEWHRSQIQTFCYEGDDGLDLHIIRDLTKAGEDEILWRELASRCDHDTVYARKMIAKERFEADVLADRINRLLGETK